MGCGICNKPVKKINRKYCSRECANKSKFGRKRPDVTHRNEINNPMRDPVALEKMREKQIGKTHSERTRLKMSKAQKEYDKNHPGRRAKLLAMAEEKYLSKVRGTSWRMIRTNALKRDNYTCQKCWGIKKTKLVVHHLDWRGKRRAVPVSEWNNELSNLQTLCHKCHNGIHRHKAKDYHKRKNQIAP